MKDTVTRTGSTMTDPELIAFLRRKHSDLLMAVLAYEECLEQTTPEREADIKDALSLIFQPGQDDTIYHVVFEAMRPTNDKRLAAWMKVREAGTMTWNEAIQSDPEISDEDRAYWLNAATRPTADRAATEGER